MTTSIVVMRRNARVADAVWMIALGRRLSGKSKRNKLAKALSPNQPTPRLAAVMPI
jgi:hypothetical protein